MTIMNVKFSTILCKYCNTMCSGGSYNYHLQTCRNYQINIFNKRQEMIKKQYHQQLQQVNQVQQVQKNIYDFEKYRELLFNTIYDKIKINRKNKRDNKEKVISKANIKDINKDKYKKNEEGDKSIVLVEPKITSKKDRMIERELMVVKNIGANTLNQNDLQTLRMMRQYDMVDIYRDYLNGKRVALIGPSKSIKGTRQGYYIDAYDLTVRLNKSIPVPYTMREDVGSRNEILYNNMNTTDFVGENILDSKMFKNNGVKFICSSYPPIGVFKDDVITFVKQNKNILPFHYVNENIYLTIVKYLGTRPLTGICAIVDLLKMPIKELYITGMDFYKTGYYDQYSYAHEKSIITTNNSNAIHSVDIQIDFLRFVVLTDQRVIVDKVLKWILFSDYDGLLGVNQKIAKEISLINYQTKKQILESRIISNKKKVVLVNEDIGQMDLNKKYGEYIETQFDLIIRFDNSQSQSNQTRNINEQIIKMTVGKMCDILVLSTMGHTIENEYTLRYERVKEILVMSGDYKKLIKKLALTYALSTNDIYTLSNKYINAIRGIFRKLFMSNPSDLMMTLIYLCIYHGNGVVYTYNLRFIGYREQMLYNYLIRNNIIYELI